MGDIFDYFFLYLLTIMLAAFKLTEFIDWSWWIICAPTILGFLLHVMVLMIGDK